MQKLLQLIREGMFIKYGIAALLLAIPLYPKFPIFGIPGTYVAVRLEDFLILFISLVWLVFLVKSGKLQDFFKDNLNLALFLFFAAGLLSVLSAVLLTYTASPHLAFLHLARRIEYTLPFFIAATSTRINGATRFLIEVILVSMFFIFLYGVGQIYANFPVISTQNVEYARGLALRLIPGVRIHSTFAGHYDLAAFSVLVFPIAMAFFFSLKKFFARIITLGVFLIPSYWLFLQTGSRISFAGFLVGTSVTLIAVKKKLFLVPFLIISILGMIFFSDLGERYRNTLEFYFERVSSVVVKPALASGIGEILGVEDRSTSIRLDMEWPRAIRAFLKNPLLGTGYSSITLATDNDYLRMLGEVGILGVVAFLLVLLRLLGRLIRFLSSYEVLDSHKAFVGGFLGSLFGVLVNATFIDVFEASKVAIIFWTLAGVAVAISRNDRNSLRND